MGAASGKSGLESAIMRAGTRTGTMVITGRYHRLPKRLEDDYNIAKEVLGKGYNGEVLLAESKSSAGGEKYAVKPFKLSGITAEKKEELESECEIFLGMDHPHVARLTDVYEADGKLNLVMECMSGGEVFKRVLKEKRFSEKDAVDTAWQMLLAINYIHSQQVVHRDIKLENFLYEKEGGRHLKLIDFGFSKIWKTNTKMHLSCGTLAYVAPEVLAKSYGNKCDMWSLGVTVFILLVGYMPFSGREDHQIASIKAGKWSKKEHLWKKVSKEATSFIERLLVVDPEKRMSAAQALEHPWVKRRDDLFQKEHEVQQDIVDALASFAQASHFRRATMNMMAWSLTNEERSQVRDAFVEMDTDRSGTITIAEFKAVMEDKFHIDDEQAVAAFEALDLNHQEEIHYSEFLAAMASTRIKMHDDLIKKTFHRFDVDGSGFITGDNLKTVLGETMTGEDVDKVLIEIDSSHDGQISYDEFFQYMTHPEAHGNHHDLAAGVVDYHLETAPERTGERKRTARAKSKESGAAAADNAAAGGKAAQPCCTVM